MFNTLLNLTNMDYVRYVRWKMLHRPRRYEKMIKVPGLENILLDMFEKQKKTLQHSKDKILREDILTMGYKPIDKDVENQPIQIFYKGDEYLYWNNSTGNYMRYGRLGVDDGK